MSASRGARQSLFIGRRAPLVEDGQPLLYPRYSKVSEIMLKNAATDAANKTPARPQPVVKPAPATAAASGSAVKAAVAATPAKRPTAQEVLLARYAATKAANESPTAASPAAAAAADGGTPKPKREKKKKKRAAEGEAADGEIAVGDAAVASEQKAKKQKKAKKEAAAQPDGSKQSSGPSNADEAATIRSTLGVTAAPAAVAQPLTFGFGFNVEPAAEPVSPPEPTGNAAAPHQQESEQPAAAAVPSKPQPADTVAAIPGQEYVPRRIFVGGMPFSYEEDAIRDYWGYCGAIEKLDILRFPDTGRFKGMAFITFKTQEAYEAALACSGSELDGQTLKVDRCKAPTKKKAEGTQQQPVVHVSETPPKVPGYWVAYVGNISFDAEVSEIEEIFASCDVQQVRLHTDKESGRSKGYAHVHFPSEEMLEKAVALNGADLHGRNLRVSYAQAKKQKN